MSKKPLTRKQHKVLVFIKKHIKKKGFAPTLQTIKEYMGVASTSTAQFYVDQLVDKGYIEREARKASALTVNSGV